MKQDERIWLLTADLGYGLMDEIRDNIPNRFINTGASEAACSDICVGLALSGKIPVMYSITPFLLYRCFETWRTYVNHEKLHVILIGSGRDKDYEIDRFSHDASDDKIFMQGLRNIISIWPKNTTEASNALDSAIGSSVPWYINLKR